MGITTPLRAPQSSPIYIVDIIRDIVNGMTPDLLPVIQANETLALGKTLINTIDYQYGHVKELIATLFQYDKSQGLKYTKYPLVYLLMDFAEKRGYEVGFYGVININLILIHQTDPSYKMTDRMNNVFRPVLYPIYYSLLNAIADSPWINENDPQMIKHTKIDRGFWGTEAMDATVLNDYVDAIDITNMQLTILSNNC